MESHNAIREHESLREVTALATTDKKTGLGKVHCKMGEGWTCIITKTEGPDADKVFLRCSENCSYSIDGETVSKELNLGPNVVSSNGSGSQAFCKCGEGWTCVIFRTEGPDASSGKGSAECAGQCSCTIDTKPTQEI